MADREFLLRIVGDVSDAQKSLGRIEKDVSGFKSTAKTVGAAIGTYFAVDAVATYGRAIVDAASATEQALGGSQQVFGEYAGEIEAFSETTAQSMGISQRQFLELSNVTGSLLKNTGAPMEEVADTTKLLTERAADMAAMFGGDVNQALEAINSGLKGEMDPLDNFGVSLKASAIDAKAQAMGLVDAEGKVTDYGKAMATTQLIMEKSASTAGTFARESGSLAGQTAIMKAQFADLQADLGAKLLPILVQLGKVLMVILDFVQRNQTWLVPLVVALGTFAAAVKIATLAQAAFNITMALNPIVLVVAAVVALVAALVLAYKKVEWFRNAVDAAIDGVVIAFRAMVQAAKWVGQVLKTVVLAYTWPYRKAFEIIRNVIMKLPDIFRNVIAAVGRIVDTVKGAIERPFKSAVEGVRYLMGLIGDAVRGVVDGIKYVMGTVADAITYPFRIAFDAIKYLWNSTLGGFGFDIPSWVPLIGGRSFSIPSMAAGGIVSRPTVALIGEAGPEAVVPLNRAGVAGVVINVYALTPNAEVGRQVFNALREYERTSGKSIA